MKIYLDYIFLENLIVNTVIILETIIFTKSKISIKRKVFVIILDTISKKSNMLLYYLFSIFRLNYFF